MAVDMETVRAALLPEEPEYARAAKSLGPDALPHLEKLITGGDTSLAAKAAYLAGMIGTEQSEPAMRKAAASGQPVVRIAAASSARHLSDEHRDALVLQLIDDADPGVRKIALRSAPATMSDALKARVTALRAAPAPAPAKTAARKSAKPAKAKKKAAAKAAPRKKRK